MDDHIDNVVKIDPCITIQKHIRGYLCRKNINYIILKFIFSYFNLFQFTNMLHDTYYLPDDNHYRFIKSTMREYTISTLLPKSKYVGDNSAWNTDIIYPNVGEIEQKHIKMEIKCVKGLFSNNKGDTRGIIIKNGRGVGQSIISLLRSVMKNIFILIDTEPPFSISYCDPKELLFYTKAKKDAKKYEDILRDKIFSEEITSELKAYINKTKLKFIGNNLINSNHIKKISDPVQEMIFNFAERYHNDQMLP